jgi:2-polyprenyl-3-methyl-5-hydroxy-6-metoxy-1,4-benzoquinol methylase
MNPPMASEFTKYETRGAYHWEEIGQRWTPRYSARLHALYSWFVDEVSARRPALVIDVGCGDAALTDRMARATPGGRVVGIEPEPSGVEFAQGALSAAQSPAEVMLGRGEELPFETGSAGLVTMCEVVEHIADVGPLVREAARVLAPDGALLVSTPQWQRPELRPFHVREYRGTELAHMLGEHFGRVRVQASEPGRLQDLYLSSTPTRIAVNLLSQAGMNPFRVRRSPTDGRAGWRQLVAVAEAPVFSANSSTRGPLRS